MNIRIQSPDRGGAPRVIDRASPIRDNFLSLQELANLGRELARAKRAELFAFAPFGFSERLKDNEQSILVNYRSIAEASLRKELITPAAEWLLDHHYTVRENFRQVRRDLPVRYFRQLPDMPVHGEFRMPRAFAIAWQYVANTDSTFNPDTLTAVVEGFQEFDTLTIGEIWAVPAILRFVLLENLRRLSNRMDRSRRMRLEANLFADWLMTERPPHRDAADFREREPLTADDAFSAQLLYRLREDSSSTSDALAWLEDRLEARGSDAEEVMIAEHTRISTNNLTVGNIIRSLKRIDDFDWMLWFENVSKVDLALREESDFAELDPRTRNHYRTAIEKIARRSRTSELGVTQLALEMSVAQEHVDSRRANVGFFLIDEGLVELKHQAGYRAPALEKLGRAYRRAGLGGLLLPTLVMAALIVAGAGWLLAAQTALPAVAIACLLAAGSLTALEASAAVYRNLIFAMVSPAHLPGYELKSGVPETARTLVVIPCLITDRDTVATLVRNLEVHLLANPDRQITYALLSDWADSEVEVTEADRELLAFAKSEIDGLAAKYAEWGGRRFFLLHRRRLYNPAEGVWMGWERKRGKLHELNLLLRGDTDTTFEEVEPGFPKDIQFVLTLDSDTRLPRDSARQLIGKLCHPLNAPIFDPASGRVVKGYGILQPRIAPSLTTGDEASVFQRIFSCNRGLDPYVFAVSDLYQDLFGEGSFTGKGLYHVDAFSAALDGRIEENTVLSHDLLEGSLARSGLVTDVAFVEDFPTRYAVEASRQHRWARGDWQLLPYIFGRSGLTNLSRFKMLDNLRRSLMSTSWIVASLLGACLLDPSHAAVWQLGLILALFLGPVITFFTGAVPRQVGVTFRGHARTVFNDFVDLMAQIGLNIVFMAHNAASMLDAMIRTLYRLAVSRRHLLEWKTTQQVQFSTIGSLGHHYRLMWPSLLIGAAAMLLPLSVNPWSAATTSAFGFAWILAPAVAAWVSRTLENEDRLKISPTDTMALRVIGRRTWRFFETFVTEEHNCLPPDNFQELPEPLLAHRTSPTNIGLYLLSTITARDMGWISFVQCLDRLEKTLSTVERMEKFRGHLFNWYDTKDLRVLHPHYVSSVDSGNLAGHLIVVSSTLREWEAALAVHLIGDIQGIADTAQVLSETLATLPDDRRSIRPLRRRMEERLEGFEKTVRSYLGEPEFAPVRSISLSVIADDIDGFARDLDHEIGSDITRLLVEWSMRLKANCEAHFADAVFEHERRPALRQRMKQLAERARAIAFGMDFSFLLNKERRLLSIGYNGEAQRLDESCYDLLASEARLTSLFAIAKGDIPSEHWFRLGRPVTTISGQACLVSWSGSMFEYLMPPIVMHERQGGVLNQTDNLAIERQIAYGRSLSIPWGISESAYHARDREMNYQYHNFGVPGLGLKRDLGNNLVLAPYASMLASQFKPREAIRNLRRLERLGALGVFGFYDAVDFTEARVPEGSRAAVVQNYMAHHQGMSITAIGNAVLNGRLRDRFHSDPVIEAAELLLQEKAPRETIPVRTPAVGEPVSEPAGESQAGARFHMIEDPIGAKRALSVLSNGHYSIMTSATGSGYSRWNGLDVTRWRADPASSDWGFYVFLRDIRSGDWWSASPGPKPAAGEEASTVFADEKTEFLKIVGDVRSKLECLVTTEADAEGRRLTLINKGTKDRLIEVTSYGELVLAAADSDAAHPAFSKMFVQTEIGPDKDVIYARSQDEPHIEVAHLICGARGRGAEAETDRRAFIGRGHELSTARAFDKGSRLEGHQGFTLDPIFALRRTVRVPAGKNVSLVFWTIAAPNRAELDRQVVRTRNAECFANEARLAWTRSQIQIRHLDTTHAEALLFQRIASYLIYPDTRLRQAQAPGNVASATQASLWPLAISGDFPIFALRIDDEADLAIVQKAFRMQEYLRARGVIADLVIINEKASSYAQDVQHGIDFMCENARRRGISSGPAQHIFSVRKDLMEPETYEALISAARIVLHTRNGLISEQIDRLERLADGGDTEAGGKGAKAAKVVAQRVGVGAVPTPLPKTGGDGLHFWNGYGGFDDSTGDYVIRLRGGEATPHPWINVISNGVFGFHMAAEGAGFTWSVNSRDYQLTPWTNDTVVNRLGEAIHVRDMKSGHVYSPFAAASRDPKLLHEIRHRPGSSTFRVDTNALAIELKAIVDRQEPAKLMRLSIANKGGDRLSLRIYAYAEWVLGNNRARTAPFIRTWYDPRSKALMARNPFSTEHSTRTAFLATDLRIKGLTMARGEYLGDDSSTFAPYAVIQGLPLSNTLESDGDPCAALAIDIAVGAGETTEALLIIGDVEQEDLVAPLVNRLVAKGFDAALAETEREWADFLGTLDVTTPDKGFDLLVNTWLPYQGLACRIRARSAFYQASGAFGFRDQLQDTLAFMLQDPSLARGQIINAAGRQFLEGDVQHWWLPRSGAGVRTLISDDVVWLAYGVSHYIGVTGDRAILDEQIAYLKGEELGEKHESFFEPEQAEEKAPLYDHVVRALDLAMRRTGEHGLPLILAGDWNDGMNRVGIEGRGESTWLAWFMIHTLDQMIPIARSRGDAARADAWQQHRQKLKSSVEAHAWDGEWYRRGYFDDGSPLGSRDSEECRIDSIAQSWAVLSGAADAGRAEQAMNSAGRQLMDSEDGVLRLFTPPFDKSSQDPGYIKAYPPGVRENGGQYTHAAIWFVYALARMGRADEAYKAFAMINPINHALTRDAADRYRVEPYVVAADVYGEGDRAGRGGWTWYTGSAGWLYRTAVEAILGIRREGDAMIVDPCLPTAWPGFEARLRQQGKTYEIKVERGETKDYAIHVDGVKIDGNRFELRPG